MKPEDYTPAEKRKKAAGQEVADPLRPSAALLAKLGSVVVHVEELLSSRGHAFDRAALASVLNDQEVVDWLAVMRAMALIPERRA